MKQTLENIDEKPNVNFTMLYKIPMSFDITIDTEKQM